MNQGQDPNLEGLTPDQIELFKQFQDAGIQPLIVDADGEAITEEGLDAIIERVSAEVKQVKQIRET